MSDIQMGPGWWLASNQKWYPPPDQAPKAGWWVAADGKWYPPRRAPREAAPGVAVVSSSPSAPTQLLEALPVAVSNGAGPTEPTRRLPQPLAQRSAARSRSFGLAVALGGAVLAIASALPWATASIGALSVSVAGTSDWGDGWITLGIGFALLVAGGGLWAFSGVAWRVLASLLALAGLGMAIFEFVHITNETLHLTRGSSLLPVQASIAYGVVVLVVGALIAAAGATGAMVAWRRSDAGW